MTIDKHGSNKKHFYELLVGERFRHPGDKWIWVKIEPTKAKLEQDGQIIWISADTVVIEI